MAAYRLSGYFWHLQFKITKLVLSRHRFIVSFAHLLLIVTNNKYWVVYIGTGTSLAKYIMFDMFRPLFWDGQKYREKIEDNRILKLY